MGLKHDFVVDLFCSLGDILPVVHFFDSIVKLLSGYVFGLCDGLLELEDDILGVGLGEEHDVLGQDLCDASDISGDDQQAGGGGLDDGDAEGLGEGAVEVYVALPRVCVNVVLPSIR